MIKVLCLNCNYVRKIPSLGLKYVIFLISRIVLASVFNYHQPDNIPLPPHHPSTSCLNSVALANSPPETGGVPRSGEGVDKLFVCVVSLSCQFLSTPSVTSFLVPLSQWDSLLARYSINFQSQATSCLNSVGHRAKLRVAIV